MDSKRIKLTIIAVIILFAVCSLAIGLLTGQSEGPDPVQAASAEVNTNTDIASVQLATPTPIGTVVPTATTIVATTKATPVPTTVKQTVAAPTQTKVGTSTSSTPSSSNVILKVGEYCDQKRDGWYHGVTIYNKGEEPFKGVVTLSYESQGKTYTSDFNIDVQGSIGSTVIDFPGKNDFKGFLGTKIIAYHAT